MGLTNEYIHGKVKVGDTNYAVGELVGGTVTAIDGEYVIIE